MGTTSPDLLPWPEFGDPGAVPTDMHELALAIQTALNKRIGLATTATLAAHGNFTVTGAPQVFKMGRLVVARGRFTRSVNLAAVDNTEYQFAVIPAGYRPAADTYMAGTWLAQPTGQTPSNFSATQMIAKTTGELTFIANFTGTVRLGGDYVAAGGLTWWTP